MHSEEPVTLYIVTEPVDKQRLQPLVRVLVNMIVRLSATGLSFEGGMPKPNFSHRLLLMLDEFPSLGRLDILHESLAFLPGYGIKA
jgi:type IV secretion system protein VirD4